VAGFFGEILHRAALSYIEQGTCLWDGVQRRETRDSHPCERGAGLLRSSGPASQFCTCIRSHHFTWRCVMSLDPESVPRQNPGSLQSCFGGRHLEQREARGECAPGVITSVLCSQLLAARYCSPIWQAAHLSWPSLRRFRVSATSPQVHKYAKTARLNGECALCALIAPANLTPTSRTDFKSNSLILCKSDSVAFRRSVRRFGMYRHQNGRSAPPR